MEIGKSAFSHCNLLSEVFIPDSVRFIGDFAFSSCDSLVKLRMSKFVDFLGYNVFFGAGFESQDFVVENGVLRYDGKYRDLISNVVIPEGVVHIGDFAFNGFSNLSYVTLPNSIKTIGRGAFGDCLLLKSINIPDGTKEIGSSAFLGCKNLKYVDIPHSVDYIGDTSFESSTIINRLASKKTEFFREENLSDCFFEPSENENKKTEFFREENLSDCLFEPSDEFIDALFDGICVKKPVSFKEDTICSVPKNKNKKGNGKSI